ncbi:hypothetical protein BOTCAL_0310g00050 [Botryotinia calthae]|uniref:Uncharacterized protein n=1 Tax=Botryotinia calthae TaxID=38488 RepID=A0A4Y8CUS3_9HELO|nr:hypothetical protein BOTCAL_0310g00050 [Botryotinia calthae]
MPMAPINVAMSEASFQPRGSGQRGSNDVKQGLLQETYCEKSSEKVHEKPAKESLISKFKFSKSKPDVDAQEEKTEKEQEKETKKKIKENEKIEKQKKENERKMERKIKDEERKISKEKLRETEKKIQEEKKILKERIKIEKEIRHIKAEYKRRNKRIEAEAEDFDRRCPKDEHQLVKDGQPLWEMLLRLEEECRYEDALAKHEKDRQIEQLKSKMKALDLQLSMPGEEVLQFSQWTTLDDIVKEQERERLGKSTQIEESVAQPRQPAQSEEEEPTKECTLPVVSQEVDYSMEDNPFYVPGEFKYQKMGEWDSETCKEWIYDSNDDGLTGPELRHLLFQVKKMTPICGKNMFGATEEEWAQWLGIHGLLTYDKLQKIAEVVKVDM